jgi:hypothetical protein
MIRIIVSALALCAFGPITFAGDTFESENITLHGWLDLGDFGNPSNGSDCWGYTSPSGRH